LTLESGDRKLFELAKLMGPRILILGMFQLVFLFTNNLASNLEEGSITAINMGWIMMQMPEVIFAMAIATAAFPTMSQLVAQRDAKTLQETVSKVLRAILFLTLPSVVALLLLGRSYISLLFRSSVFDERAVDMVYRATAAFTVGLLGHSLLELAARIFYAHKNTVLPFYFACGATALNMGLCVVLAGWLGQAGLALANSIAVTLQSCLLLWLGWRSRVRFAWKPVWTLVGQSLLASAVMAGIVLAVQQAPWLGRLGTALVATAAGGGAYLAVMGLLSWYAGTLVPVSAFLRSLRRR
jgi:putative peptidoglycan lipid II flippase